MRDGMRERMGAGWKKPPPTVVKTATRKKEKKRREEKRGFSAVRRNKRI